MAREKQKGFIATVKLGPKGQIVIPKEVRDMFGVGPGDSLILMAEPNKGIALQKQSVMLRIAETILGGGGKNLYPTEKEDDMKQFAGLIQDSREVEE